jgi:hypothetical protein
MGPDVLLARGGVYGSAMEKRGGQTSTCCRIPPAMQLPFRDWALPTWVGGWVGRYLWLHQGLQPQVIDTAASVLETPFALTTA